MVGKPAYTSEEVLYVLDLLDRGVGTQAVIAQRFKQRFPKSKMASKATAKSIKYIKTLGASNTYINRTSLYGQSPISEPNGPPAHPASSSRRELAGRRGAALRENAEGSSPPAFRSKGQRPASRFPPSGLPTTFEATSTRHEPGTQPLPFGTGPSPSGLGNMHNHLRTSIRTPGSARLPSFAAPPPLPPAMQLPSQALSSPHLASSSTDSLGLGLGTRTSGAATVGIPARSAPPVASNRMRRSSPGIGIGTGLTYTTSMATTSSSPRLPTSVPSNASGLKNLNASSMWNNAHNQQLRSALTAIPAAAYRSENTSRTGTITVTTFSGPHRNCAISLAHYHDRNGNISVPESLASFWYSGWTRPLASSNASSAVSTSKMETPAHDRADFAPVELVDPTLWMTPLAAAEPLAHPSPSAANTLEPNQEALSTPGVQDSGHLVAYPASGDDLFALDDDDHLLLLMQAPEPSLSRSPAPPHISTFQIEAEHEQQLLPRDQVIAQQVNDPDIRLLLQRCAPGLM